MIIFCNQRLTRTSCSFLSHLSKVIASAMTRHTDPGTEPCRLLQTGDHGWVGGRQPLVAEDYHHNRYQTSYLVSTHLILLFCSNLLLNQKVDEIFKARSSEVSARPPTHDPLFAIACTALYQDLCVGSWLMR